MRGSVSNVLNDVWIDFDRMTNRQRVLPRDCIHSQVNYRDANTVRYLAVCVT